MCGNGESDQGGGCGKSDTGFQKSGSHTTHAAAGKRTASEASGAGDAQGPAAGASNADGQYNSGTAGQYIVVSHRPQVFERAPCLIGVYTLGGTSHAALVHIPQQGG